MYILASFFHSKQLCGIHYNSINNYFIFIYSILRYEYTTLYPVY